MELSEQEGEIVDICNSSAGDVRLLTQTTGEHGAVYQLLSVQDGLSEHICTLGTTDFFTVKEAITVDEGIYQVSPFFAVYTLLGKEREVGSELGWTYDDFLSCVQENKEIINNVTQYDLLRMLCYRSLDNYIDWQNGTVHFECEEFVDKLQFIKDYDYPVSTQMPYYYKLRSGNIMLVEGYLRSGNDYRTYKYAFGEEISAKGYPCKDRNGNYMDLIAPMGISSRSAHKKIAWEFIEDVLSEEIEYTYHDMGFPSRKKYIKHPIAKS